MQSVSDGKKILVSGLTNSLGGTESVVSNIVRTVGDVFDFEFVATSNLSSLNFTQGRVVHTVPDLSNPVERMNSLKFLFQSEQFDAVWCNFNHYLYSDILRYAAKYSIPIRIAQAHSTRFLGKERTQLLSGLLRSSVIKNSTVRLACSSEAGKFYFKDAEFSVVVDSVYPQDYAFSKTDRNNIRNSLNLSNDQLVIGTVGRLVPEKNQDFLLRCLYELRTFNIDAKLIVVGDGPLLSELNQNAIKLKLQQDVFFVGQQRDVGKYLSSFDIFALPSLFEGFGLAALEAQFNGLPCVVSSNVPTLIDISNCVFHVPLEDTNSWIDYLSKLNRDQMSLDSRSATFDITNQKDKLIKLFFKGIYE